MPYQGNKQRKAISIKAAGKPEAEQLAAINALTLKEMTEDEVYVRTAILAHNAIDRDREVFDKGLLQDYARTIVGKGLFIKHPRGYDGDSGPPVGRWFEAELLEMSQDEARKMLREPSLQWAASDEKAYLLQVSYYIPRSGKNADLITDIDAGVASDVSIGFGASDRTAIKDGNDNTIAYRILGPGEALEGSLVWLGAQPGARTVKAAGQSNESTEEEPTMAMTETEQKAFDQAKADAQAATDKLKELEPKAATHDAIMKAAGEGVDEKSVITLIGAGTEYLKQLKSDLLRLERLQGVVGDSEDDGKAAMAVYGGMSIDVLAARVKALAVKYPGTSEIDGSDPNASGAEGGKGGGKGLRDASVTTKALGQDKAA